MFQEITMGKSNQPVNIFRAFHSRLKTQEDAEESNTVRKNIKPVGTQKK